MRTNQQLKDLNLPRFNWRELIQFIPTPDKPYMPEHEAKAMDDYFIHFLPPGPCIKCGAIQAAETPIDKFLGKGRFKPAILRYGEGQCSTPGCYWPGRYMHHSVGPIKVLNMVLQYHPEVVTWD